jgi:hypothetical protein
MMKSNFFSTCTKLVIASIALLSQSVYPIRHRAVPVILSPSTITVEQKPQQSLESLLKQYEYWSESLTSSQLEFLETRAFELQGWYSSKLQEALPRAQTRALGPLAVVGGLASVIGLTALVKNLVKHQEIGLTPFVAGGVTLMVLAMSGAVCAAETKRKVYTSRLQQIEAFLQKLKVHRKQLLAKTNSSE